MANRPPGATTAGHGVLPSFSSLPLDRRGRLRNAARPGSLLAALILGCCTAGHGVLPQESIDRRDAETQSKTFVPATTPPRFGSESSGTTAGHGVLPPESHSRAGQASLRPNARGPAPTRAAIRVHLCRSVAESLSTAGHGVLSRMSTPALEAAHG